MRNFNYPEDKIEQVKHCILTHSSDKNYPPKSKEAKILYNADALSHFDSFMAFAHYVYNLKKMSIDEGKKYLVKKFEQDWGKITLSEAKKIAKPKYEAIKFALK